MYFLHRTKFSTCSNDPLFNCYVTLDKMVDMTQCMGVSWIHPEDRNQILRYLIMLSQYKSPNHPAKIVLASNYWCFNPHWRQNRRIRSYPISFLTAKKRPGFGCPTNAYSMASRSFEICPVRPPTSSPSRKVVLHPQRCLSVACYAKNTTLKSGTAISRQWKQQQLLLIIEWKLWKYHLQPICHGVFGWTAALSIHIVGEKKQGSPSK